MWFYNYIGCIHLFEFIKMIFFNMVRNAIHIRYYVEIMYENVNTKIHRTVVFALIFPPCSLKLVNSFVPSDNAYYDRSWWSLVILRKTVNGAWILIALDCIAFFWPKTFKHCLLNLCIFSRRRRISNLLIFYQILLLARAQSKQRYLNKHVSLQIHRPAKIQNTHSYII